MSSKMTPISAYDIWADGTAKPAPDANQAPADGAVYRWLHIDLADPALRRWCQMYLPPLAARTLLAPRTRPRVDVHDTGLVMTLRGVNLNDGDVLEDMVSLRLWATPTLVVTVRRQKVFALDDVRAQLDNGDAPDTPIRLIARITEMFLAKIEPVAEALDARAEALEAAVYNRHTPNPSGISPLQRSVIKLRRHIGPVADALEHLSTLETDLIPYGFRNRLRHTANRANRAVDEVNEIVDRLTALTDHLDLAQATRLGRNSYALSLIATIFIPLGFIAGLFSMGVGGVPMSGNPLGFYILCGTLTLIGLLILIVLKWTRWF